MIYIEDRPVPTTIFPDNTSQVWKLGSLPGRVLIRWQFSHEGEFMQLAQLKYLLDVRHIVADLYIEYLPYGRQDKMVSDETTFALHPFCELLNHLAFDTVRILDPHSEEATYNLYRSEAVYPIAQVNDTIGVCGANLICYPDAGALQKYRHLYDFPSMFGEKVRDQLTGRITSYSIVGAPKGKKVLIVDDICDGGATFVLLAQKLYEAGAESVDLFVTHGIFSAGLRSMRRAGIIRFFTHRGEITEGSLQCSF